MTVQAGESPREACPGVIPPNSRPSSSPATRMRPSGIGCPRSEPYAELRAKLRETASGALTRGPRNRPCPPCLAVFPGNRTHVANELQAASALILYAAARKGHCCRVSWKVRDRRRFDEPGMCFPFLGQPKEYPLSRPARYFGARVQRETPERHETALDRRVRRKQVVVELRLHLVQRAQGGRRILRLRVAGSLECDTRCMQACSYR